MARRIEPGQEFGGFRVIELMRRGGMATLWRVQQDTTGDMLLMKVPVLNQGEDPAKIVGFEMEQMIMPRLKGAHVPRFVANGDFAQDPFIVMELIEGTSLLPKLDVLPLPIAEVTEIAKKVATALDSLHRQRVVHLDIKPSNIMVRNSGDVVLIDFGLSRHLDLPDLVGEEFRLPYGTGPYMAPEQVMGIRHDFRSDFFALGVLMYFFATGERPFGDPQRLKGLQRRLWWDPAPPRSLRKDMPMWMQEIILRCLEVNASRRYQNAGQLLFDLNHPDEVKLTARAQKEKRDGFFQRLARKGEALSHHIDHPGDPTQGLANAPIVAVAVDLNAMTQELAGALRQSVARIVERSSETRVACLNVLKLSRMTLDSSTDEDGRNKHIARIVQLKDWARTLDVPQARISYHVLEATDPADAILDYTRANRVDHVVMGARDNSTMRSLLGSVSGKVATEAPCTVSVVRVRKDYDASDSGGDAGTSASSAGTA
ncbi:MAG: bifunctional serine/threonine-protein kinase/universal stress protein [Hyphomicrobiales bacterium]